MAVRRYHSIGKCTIFFLFIFNEIVAVVAGRMVVIHFFICIFFSSMKMQKKK